MAKYYVETGSTYDLSDIREGKFSDLNELVDYLDAHYDLIPFEEIEEEYLDDEDNDPNQAAFARWLAEGYTFIVER